jgi:RNA polymerase sigma factor (sigma-70 family)
MPAASLLAALQNRTAPALRAPDAVSDRTLLERFRARSDEAAFAALVRRHGPMVLGVARRALGPGPDAEDVCQGAFMLLARRSAGPRQPEALAAWLHGVALRLAWKCRRSSERRKAAEGRVMAAAPSTTNDASWREVLAVLDEELARLPAPYRSPLVLCYLQGKTQDEAARLLGWTLPTCRGRLERGRRKLRERLTRRGLELGAVLGTAGLAASSAQALTGPFARAIVARAVALAGEAAGRPGRWGLAAVLLLGLSAATAGLAARSAALPQEPPDRGGQLPVPMGQAREGLPPGAVARLGSDRFRHSDMIHSVAFTADGRSVVTADRSDIRVWDAAIGRLRHRFDLPADRFTSDTAATPDPRVVVSLRGGKKLTFHRLDAATGRELGRLELDQPGMADSVSFAPAGDRFAVAGKERQVWVYDATTGAEKAHFPIVGPRVWHQEFSPDGGSIALADGGDTLRVHDAANGKATAELRQEGASFRFVTFAPDGRSLASIEESGGPERGVSVVRLRDLATRSLSRTFTGNYPYTHNLTFSPDGRLLAAGSHGVEVILWDPATGREVRRLRALPGVLRIAFSPDGQTLAAANNHGAVSLWEVASGRRLPQSADPVLSVRDLHFTPDGRRVTGIAETAIEWDAASGEAVHRFPMVGGRQAGFALSPDRRLIAASDSWSDGPIHLFDAATGAKVRDLAGHGRGCWRLLFSADGHTLYSSSWDKSVRAWDVDAGRERWHLDGFRSGVDQLALSPDGRLLAAASTDASAQGDYAIRLCEAATGRELRRFMPGHGSAFAVAFSPDGRWLASVGGEPGRPNTRGAVQLWEVATGKEVRSFEGHTERVTCVTFSADGRNLATGSIDKTVRLWEVGSGLERLRIGAHRGLIHSVAFSPDGRRLASASEDAPGYVWDVDALAGRGTADLDRLWADLAGEDAPAAFRAVRRLAGATERSLPFLRDRLKPAAGVEAGRVRQLVRDLDSPQFAARQRAVTELTRVAPDAEATLRGERDVAESVEVRKRLDRLLRGLDSTPEVLRTVRAVEALEAMGTPEATKFLGELAAGAADARLTREAVAARERRRSASGR